MAIAASASTSTLKLGCSPSFQKFRASMGYTFDHGVWLKPWTTARMLANRQTNGAAPKNMATQMPQSRRRAFQER